MVVVLVVRPWNMHRVGATVVMRKELAERFAAMGVLRILAPSGPAQTPAATEPAVKPMKPRRRAPRGR